MSEAQPWDARMYRKKPVVISAMLFTGSHESALAIQRWCGAANADVTDHGLYINTLEGRMLANCGAYVIRGVQGEFYPCQRSIFEATYEPVEG